jgi:hypothetical protein
MDEGEFQCLTTKTNAKWPRYNVQLKSGLTLAQAKDATHKLLRSPTVKVSLLSQFNYNSDTGLVDTRINRED